MGRDIIKQINPLDEVVEKFNILLEKMKVLSVKLKASNLEFIQKLHETNNRYRKESN